jgi:threonine/homoserine/homoserine lactone efflux protein
LDEIMAHGTLCCSAVAGNPQVHLRVIPTSASWLNLAGSLVRIIERQAIRRGTFRSVRELAKQDPRVINGWNDRKRPFISCGPWPQGFLSNVTNPEVRCSIWRCFPVLGLSAGPPVLWVYALSPAALSLIYLTLLVAGMSRARRVLAQCLVRRVLDGVTGLVQPGVGARFATER